MKKIKPTKAWGVTQGDKVRRVSMDRAIANMIAGLGSPIPVMIVPLDQWRAVVKRNRPKWAGKRGTR